MHRGLALRITAVAVGAAALVGLAAAPASAHTISGPKPTNYHSHIVSMAPEIPGITARVVDLGNKFEITNRTSTEITVLGYLDEPYLRIGPNGVFENLHSQATYIDKSKQGGSVPPNIDTSPTATPVWKKISSGHSARWHDHRIHWMSAQPPPTVAAAPGAFEHLSQQNIVFLYNDKPVRISVALDWVPGPSGWPWVPPIVVLFVVGLVAALIPKWWRVLAVLLAVLVLSDMAHAIGFEIPRPGGNLSKTVQFFGGSFVSVAVWIAAVPTIIALWRRRAEALYGVLFVSLLVLLIGGATDLSALWKSELPDAGPQWLTRVEVVIAIGLGGGLLVGALVRMIRSRAAADREEGRGQWLSLLVSGLSDEELARIVGELDPDDVLEVALRELATRAEPVAPAFAAGALTFVITDYEEPIVWSLVADASPAALRARRGRPAAAAAEIHAAFASVLQILAGTVTLDEAVTRGSAVTTGDPAFLAAITPYLPEEQRRVA